MIEEGAAGDSNSNSGGNGNSSNNTANAQSFYYHRGVGIDSSTDDVTRANNSRSTIYEDIGSSDDNSDRYSSSSLRRGPLHNTAAVPASTSAPYYDKEMMNSDNSLNINNWDSLENDENDHRINSNNSNRMSSMESSCAYYDRGYEDVLDKPPALSDFLINDHCYQRHLLEGKRSVYMGIRGGGSGGIKRNNTGSSVKNGTSSSSGTFLAKLCAGYSFVAMLFLIFISILLETQPLYITGISVKKKSSLLSEEGIGIGEYPYDEENYKFRRETSNALKAAAAYFLLIVLSLSYIQAKEMNLDMSYHTSIFGRVCHVRRLFVAAYCRYRRRHYDSIPDGNHPDDNDSHGGSSVSILPMHHHQHHTGETTQLLSSSSRQRKNRRSSPRNNQLDVEVGSSIGNAGNGGGGIGGGGATAVVEGVLGKLKSWGIGGGGGSSSRTGRKKDK
jgi:hypothetical protein